MIAFGPVPSRRLGRSLGINNIPPKICSYACIYCQLGNTIQMQVERKTFYNPKKIYDAVAAHIDKLHTDKEPIDYLTFVPDGEPTLDINLGQEIKLLKTLGIKIAVISNASLIWRDDVRNDLLDVDWVSLKIDAVDTVTWHKIDRPHGKLNLDAILTGIEVFSEVYTGVLATETMLVAGINDQVSELTKIANFIAQVNPSIAYLTIPTRPPAESWVQHPDETSLSRAFQIFSEQIDPVEYLIGYEGDAFAYTGDVEADLLSITAVHPMREEAVRQLLQRAKADWSIVDKLIADQQMIKTMYQGNLFFMRKLRH